MSPAVYLVLAGLVAAGLVWFLLAPRHTSMAEDERELRDYFRKKDAAERRGERYPP